MTSTTHPLPSDSHTARRLEHGTPRHLHQTTFRTFIGPIPEGWLKSHRKTWYRRYIRSGSSRAPTFTAAHPIAGDDTAAAAATETRHEAVISPDALRGLSQATETGDFPERDASTRSLLHSQHASPTMSTQETMAVRARKTGPTSVGLAPPKAAAPAAAAQSDGFRLDREPAPAPPKSALKSGPPADRKVRFTEASKLQLRARAQRLALRGNFRGSKAKEGQMLKADKMLVRVDITQQALGEEYDEKASQGVETRSLDKWREFMVVSRKHTEDDAAAVLQLYQTRVIAASEDRKVRKKPKVEILLSNSKTRVNLYSALDKTLCVWTTVKSRTTIYYIRAQSGAAAVEWYTFLHGVLGHPRINTLQVSIPDLNVSLRLDDPFRTLTSSEVLREAAKGNEAALQQVMSDEKGVAGAIVARCIDMLRGTPEWADILAAWAHQDRIGLAWKRYDRLEWIHGAVEQKMYGTIAMQRTHELELRPKDHYAATVKLRDGTVQAEPAPIEGFLVQLTSQQGHERKLGRMQFKRLYFATQNQYLLFVRPTKAVPPPPPALRVNHNASVPTAQELNDEIPLVYDINPYPLSGNEISWLDAENGDSAAEQAEHDREAAEEAERNHRMIFGAEGFINLCDVQKVRKFHRGALPLDENLDDGSDVDFHQPVRDASASRPDGSTAELDEARTFELIMKNGLVVRLQAYNKATRKEWVRRLRLLVTYWTARVHADLDLYRSTRYQNLRALGIDERGEAIVGQFAHKWEVRASYASPQLYHLCGIAACRPLHLSGTLFRKPRRHTTFSRCHVLLAHGHLLLFQDHLRARSGKIQPATHHARVGAIALQDCYVYSGLLTENDLLYQNRTFDPNTPGRHALPRFYREDGWSSTDEDAMTTFVVWHARSKSWFKRAERVDDVRTREVLAGEHGGSGSGAAGADGSGNAGKGARRAKVKTKLTRVSQLGAKGRSVVFKARSRAERDHWVLAIQVEIERMQALQEEEKGDEVRIVEGNEGENTEEEGSGEAEEEEGDGEEDGEEREER